MVIENEELLNSLLKIVRKYELTELEKGLLELHSGQYPIRAAFLGEFNAGKTTIINAVLQRQLLPAFDVPTTALVTEIAQADKDQAFVISTSENGQESRSPISFAALADHITDTDMNKKVFVGLKDLSFTTPNLLLIDTPGIASINETHDDITYGYLPQVDIAFVVINPNSGDLPRTLINFLSQFPQDLLDKIYFVISRADQLPGKALQEVKERVTVSLQSFITTPKVLSVSAKEALAAIHGGDTLNEEQYAASGIAELRNILDKKLPLYLQNIERKRLATLLDVERKHLISLLEARQAALDWSQEELHTTITQHKTEIGLLERQIEDFQKSFKRIKQDTTSKVGSIVTEFTGLIGFCLARHEPYDDLVSGMTDEVRQNIELGMADLKTITFQGMGGHSVNMDSILRTLIERETSGIREIADLVTNATTFALTAWVVPGSSAFINTGEAIAGTSVLLAQEADQVFNSDKNLVNKGFLKTFGRIAGSVGKMVKELNPLEKVKSAVLPQLLNPKLSKALTGKVSSAVSHIFDLIGHELNKELQSQFLDPLKAKEELLAGVEKAVRQKRQTISESAELLAADLDYLKKNT
ncbi:dynamin family protein [Flavobacterium subsaxonicum]|uniref:Dynamin N-terminal domain-containing protein n=1 Tax=Flavobacterium subsaxonicum WB 4.1-42 = DSM 21790 TaxID=1121898 RepID=A0A0A2ME99_9FLAO|nr:dynamin family protein [Flavobacterium subsaxonicum]KGO91017.1 hypothetical protein Q766_20220 [Flavobacterium subsaxonicum WB 4.1-42 = DSM 21790]